MNPQSNDPLDAVLKRWQPQAEASTRFQAGVWQRIAEREAASPWTFFRQRLEEWSALLTRPRYATAVLAAVVLIGAGLAQIENAATRESSQALQARYLNSLDPYSQTHS